MKPLARLFYLVPLFLLGACELPGTTDAGDSGGAAKPRSGSVENPTILCFGDSQTSGGGKIDPYPSQLGRMTGRPVASSGAGGETLVRGAARFPGVLNKTNPGVVVFLEGTNDAASGASLSAGEGALESMVKQALAKGAAVVICTIPPFQKGAAAANGAAMAVNERIRAVAARQGVALADIFKVFGTRLDLTQGDGVHLSSAGAAVVAATVADLL